MKKIILAISIALTTAFTANTANAVLGPIPIYLNTEYRTQNPVIGSIASTIKLGRADIDATGANTFLELLATIASVGFVNPQGNVPALFLRGSNSNHTLVLIDGVRVHDISSTNGAAGYALESIPVGQIERVEIIKGPYSSLYGSGAIGGVIQIFTKKGGNYSNANISIGSNNSKKVSFSNNHKDDKGFINFNLSKYQTDGISALANNTEKDGINNQSISFKIGYEINKNTDFSIGFLQSTIDTQFDDFYGSIAIGNVNGNPQRLYNHNKNWHKELKNSNLTINHHFNDKIKSKLSLTEINQNRDSFTDGISDVFNNKKYQTQDLSLLNDIKLNNALLSIGLSKIDDKNITDNQALSNKDIFAQWQRNINSFDINTGVRLINHSDFGAETVYNLGIAKYLSNDIKLTGSYGTAFNAPTLYQLNGDTFTGGNPNLKPETSKNTELGIEKQHYWGLSIIKFYKNKVKNLIGYNYAGTPNNYDDDHYFNTENILNIRGVELSLSANIKNYDISFNHNFTDSQLNNSNTQQARRPKNTSDLTISKTYNKFNSRLQMIKKSSIIDRAATLDGYTLVNLNTNYAYNNNTKLSLSINNAFDKDYTVANGYNQLGRTVNLGLNYKF